MVDDWTSCTGQWLCNQLSDGDKSSDLLLLDCRSADEYTSSHVAGSLLIVVPTMMLRRLRNGNVSVSAAISPNSSSRAVFSDRCRTSHVVLYDTSGDSLGSGADSVIQVLMNGLQKDGCRVSYLLDGFASFRRQFSHLCVERQSTTAAAAVTAADADDDVNDGSDDGHDGATVPAARPQLLRISDHHHAPSVDIFGLSNLRLSSSAPSSTAQFLHDNDHNSSCHAVQSPVHSGRQSMSPRRPTEGCCDVSTATSLPFPVQVLSNLYLGDAATARDLDCLRRHNIQYIVNVTADVDNTFEDDSTLTYMRIAITDHWSETPTTFFTTAINFIEEGRRKNVGVLVHCLAGISRSVTVTVAYLMFCMSLSLEDAYEFLRRVRPNISPNFNFMGQLADFDQTLSYARQHCSCLSDAAPLLKLCENCRRQVKTYFSSPCAAAAAVSAATVATCDDVGTTSTTLSSSSNSPFSVSSLTSSTSTHSLPSPAPAK